MVEAQRPSETFIFPSVLLLDGTTQTESRIPAGVRGGPIETSAQRSLRSSELRLEFPEASELALNSWRPLPPHLICNQGLRALWECLLSCSRQLPLLAEAQALAWELWSGSREL